MKSLTEKLVFTVVVIVATIPSNGATNDAPPLVGITEEGFRVPEPGAALAFPRAHGSHPEFRIEWWYITGHLFSDAGRRFAFQATFFRRANTPPSQERETEKFGSSQLYLAHFSFLDVANERFLHEERLNRNGWDAGASVDSLDLHNGNWTLKMLDADTEEMELHGSIRGDVSFSLVLAPAKPKVIFGKNGVSRKGADSTAASFYITFTRLAAEGGLRLDDESVEVSGEAWMDHEISSSQLADGQVGWDWCSLQLYNGQELMAYRLRREDGTSDPFSTLAWISREGKVTHFRADEFSWEPISTWTSPETDGKYPVHYRLRTISSDRREPVVLEIRPVAEAQELARALGGIAYWEGAVDVLDETGKPIGRGFTELTGYAESLYGRF